jgi:hypothetical protein
MPNYPEWQVELLSFFGVDKRNIISGEVLGRNVFLPSFTSCGTPSRRQVLSLRNVLLNSPYVPITTTTTTTTTTLSSSSVSNVGLEVGDNDATNRMIVVLLIERTISRSLSNMDKIRDELNKLATKLGFILLIYSDKKEKKNISQFSLLRLFAQASIIIGPHGAGFANMIVSRPCTTIIEAREPNHPKCYEHLAQTLGFNYIAAPRGSSGGSGGTSSSDMMSIDLKLTLELARREVRWRQEFMHNNKNKNDIDEQDDVKFEKQGENNRTSFKQCSKFADDYFSSFLDKLPYKTSVKSSSHKNRENALESFQSGSNVIPNGNGPVVRAMILDMPAPDKNYPNDIKTLLEIVGIGSRLWGWVVNNIGVGVAAVFEVALYSSALFSLVSLVYIRCVRVTQ